MESAAGGAAGVENGSRSTDRVPEKTEMLDIFYEKEHYI